MRPLQHTLLIWSYCGVLCCVVLQVMGYGNDSEAIATEADAFLDALQQLPHDNNTVVWGKSDELMLLVHQVCTCCMQQY